MPLPKTDKEHFLAAEGWLELGNIQECHNELEEISPEHKTHRTVLELRVKMYAKAEKWDHVEPIAKSLTEHVLDSPFGLYMWCHALRKLGRYEEAMVQLTLGRGKFLYEWRLSYDLACCLAQTGHKDEARLRLQEAIEQAGEKDIRTMALAAPNLDGGWSR